MKSLQDQLSKYSSGLLTDPSAGLEPIRAASTDRINRRYAAMPDKLSERFASRGYGSSGDFGNSLYETEVARSGELFDLDSQIAQLILAEKNQGASLSEQLLGMTRGTTSTSTGTTPSTAASDTFQSAGNGLNNIATLLTLSELLKK